MLRLTFYCILMAVGIHSAGQLTTGNEWSMYFAPGWSTSTISSDTLPTKPLNSLGGGFFTRGPITPQLDLKIGGAYTRRGFNSFRHHSRLRNDYLDFYVTPEYELLEGLRVGLQAQYSQLLYSRFSYSSAETGFQEKSEFPDEYGSFFAVGPQLSLEFQDGSGIEFQYQLPTREVRNYFQVSLTFDVDNTRSKRDRFADLNEGIRHIKELKQNMILVRLMTLERSIQALQDIGLEVKSEELAATVQEQNKKIMAAFKSEFDFCPAYFFYSNNTIPVRKGDSSVLFDVDGNPVELQLEECNFYVADFGNLEQDTAQYFSGYDLVRVGNFKTERVRRTYTRTSFSFGAMKIKGCDFIQLRDPFPYYVKTYGSFVFKRSPLSFIRRMNEKFHDFYNAYPAYRGDYFREY